MAIELACYYNVIIMYCDVRILMFYEMKLYCDACTYAFIYMNKENMIPVIGCLFESPQKLLKEKKNWGLKKKRE